MGSLTITTNPAQDARMVAAFGRYLGLGRNATGPEIRSRVIQFLREVVQGQERIDAPPPAIPPFDPT